MPKVSKRKLKQKQKQRQSQNVGVKQSVKINLVAARRARTRRIMDRRGGPGAFVPPPYAFLPGAAAPPAARPPVGFGAAPLPPPPPPPPPRAPPAPAPIPPAVNNPFENDAWVPQFVPIAPLPAFVPLPAFPPPAPMWMANPNFGGARLGDAIDPPAAVAAAAPPPPGPALYDRDAAVAAYLRRFPPPPVPPPAAPAAPPAPAAPAPIIDPNVPGAGIFANLPVGYQRRRYQAVDAFDAQAEFDRLIAQQRTREREQVRGLEAIAKRDDDLRYAATLAEQEGLIGGHIPFNEISDPALVLEFKKQEEENKRRDKQINRIFGGTAPDNQTRRERSGILDAVGVNRIQRQYAITQQRKKERSRQNEDAPAADVPRGGSLFDSNTSSSSASIPDRQSMGPNTKALHLSMESFRNNQAELRQNISQVEQSLARADEARLARDEAAGLGARAPQPARPRGLEPQLPMSIFAHSLPKGVTGRTKERRESLGVPRQELNLSEVNIRDPVNDSEILFVSPFRRNPEDLQRSPEPLPGFDLSPISRSNSSSSQTTIPDAAELQRLLREYED